MIDKKQFMLESSDGTSKIHRPRNLRLQNLELRHFQRTSVRAVARDFLLSQAVMEGNKFLASLVSPTQNLALRISLFCLTSDWLTPMAWEAGDW